MSDTRLYHQAWPRHPRVDGTLCWRRPCSQRRSCRSCNGAETQNVLLISIDTLRADYLTSYGFPRETTPNIDDIAREGVLFKHVISPVPTTLPAHSSMLTGTIPPVHGMHDNLSYRLADANVTLAEMLGERGYTTGAIVSSFVLDSKFNLSQGFDTYDDRFEEEHKILLLSERKGDETTRLARQWLEDHRDENFFLFLHYYDPHHDYDPPEPFASRFADDLYAGEIAFADHGVGQVVDKLEELGLMDSTWIVVTSDHGEMLGEHRRARPRILHLSERARGAAHLQAAGPHRAEAGRPDGRAHRHRTDASRHSRSRPAPGGARRRPLPLLEPVPAKAPVPGKAKEFYAQSLTPTRYYDTSALYGLVTSRWKYIQTTRPELYDLTSDPDEERDVAQEETDIAEAMKTRLAEILESHRQEQENRIELDDASVRRLESLGYLARGSSAVELRFEQDKDDPKDWVDFYGDDQQATELVHEREYNRARPLAERMLRTHPDHVPALLLVAQIALGQEEPAEARYAYARAVALEPENENAHFGLARALTKHRATDEAIPHLRRAIELRPDYTEAKARLARALTEQGRIDEAATLLREAVAAEPDSVDAATQLGLALAAGGKFDEAMTHYRRALALDAGSAEAHFYLANTLVARQQPEEALDHFRQALRIDPERAAVRYRFGVALRELGKTNEATQQLEEALRIDPDLAPAHNELGVTLKQQGKPEEAARHYRRALALEPQLAAAHNNLGSLLGSQGNLDAAIVHFRQCLESEPRHAEAHNNLGLALRMRGGRDEPLSHFRAALAERPEWTEPMNEIAWIVATHPDAAKRNPDEAVRLAESAAKLTGHRQPVVLDTLAAAYASAGDFPRAIRAAEEAVALAATRDTGLADEMRTRLALYRAEERFRERF